MKDVPLWVAAFLISAFLSLVALGIRLETLDVDWFVEHPFLGNLISELAGLFLGVAVATLIIERAIKKFHERRWRTYRRFHAVMFAHHANGIARAFHAAYHDLGLTDIFQQIVTIPVEGLVTTLSEAAKDLRSRRKVVRTSGDLGSDFHKEGCPVARAHLDRLHQEVVPKFLELSNDEGVDRAVVHLALGRWRWESSVDQTRAWIRKHVAEKPEASLAWAVWGGRAPHPLAEDHAAVALYLTEIGEAILLMEALGAAAHGPLRKALEDAEQLDLREVQVPVPVE